MLQDPNKGKGLSLGQEKMEQAGSDAVGQFAEQAVGQLADQAGDKVKDVKEKAEQARALASAAAKLSARESVPFTPLPGYPSTFYKVEPLPPGAPKYVRPEPKPFNDKPSNAQLINDNLVLGVAHLVKLTLVVEGRQIKNFKHFTLSQSASKHHHFTLILDHDALGEPESHYMDNAQQLLGKRILVTFTYKNIPNGPIRDFIGVVTKVGLSRENRNHGNIEVSGYSPTILLDGAPHIQSFGGARAMSLNSIVHRVLQQGLGSDKYPVSIDSTYENVAYSCQYEESHYNYLARLAETYGEQFYYDGETVRFGKLPFSEKAIELIFGKNVDRVDIAMKALHVNPIFYGYNSSDNKKLRTNPSTIKHMSSLGKSAYSISQETFTAPSLRVAPLKARTSKDLDASQDSTAGSSAVSTFTTSGRTSVPFLYPGCVVDMEIMKPGSKKSSYFTRLMIIEINHSVDKLGNYEGHFEAIGSDTGYLPRPEFHVPKGEAQFATVINNKDAIGRVQVRFDWQSDAESTEWIRVMTPDAGSSEQVSKNRGFVFIPELGDQVMVDFVHSHPDRPYVMGGLFHGKVSQGGGEGNNIKSLSSKSGHTLRLDDAGGITVEDKDNNSIFLSGDGHIHVNSKETILMSCGASSFYMDKDGNIALNGKQLSITGETLEVIGSQEINVGIGAEGAEPTSGFNIQASAFDLKTTDLSIEAKSNLSAQATKVGIAGSGTTVIQGGKIDLN